MRKYVVGFIFGLIVCSGIIAIATGLSASNTSFEPTDPNWNVSTVDEALNDLYSLSNDDLIFVGTSWKTAKSWDYYGLYNNLLSNSGYVTHSVANDVANLTINKNTTLKIKIFLQNAGALDNKPKYELYKNDVLIQEVTNTTAMDDLNTMTLTVTANQGDVFYAKLYGGGNRPFYCVTLFELMDE